MSTTTTAAPGRSSIVHGKKRVLASAFAGTTIEWYDFYLYGTAAALVFNVQFFPMATELGGIVASFATLAVGVIARPLGGIIAAQGVSDRAVPELAWSAVSRLGLGSALRRLADEGAACVVATRSGVRHEVVLTRVGEDFVEAEAETGGGPARRLLVSLGSIGAVQSREPR